jgi:hypothetical protein
MGDLSVDVESDLWGMGIPLFGRGPVLSLSKVQHGFSRVLVDGEDGFVISHSLLVIHYRRLWLRYELRLRLRVSNLSRSVSPENKNLKKDLS